MFTPVNKTLAYVEDNIHSSINSQLKTFHEKGATPFILEKLRERNPLQSSSCYKKQSKALTKHLRALKGIKRKMSARLKKQDNPILRNHLKNVSERIGELQIRLNYLKTEEAGQTILKMSAPCNLILPGSGETLRMAAYGLKMVGATSYYMQKSNGLHQVVQVAREVTLARSTTVISQFAYDKIRSLKESITYSNFRSLLYYYVQF